MRIKTSHDDLLVRAVMVAPVAAARVLAGKGSMVKVVGESRRGYDSQTAKCTARAPNRFLI